MATSSTQNDSLGTAFTKEVIESMGPNTSPRLREVMGSLITHIHDFARDVQLTTDEWMMGVKMINWAGQMSDEKRNEGQLLCDVIGLESCVLPTKFLNHRLYLGISSLDTDSRPQAGRRHHVHCCHQEH